MSEYKYLNMKIKVVLSVMSLIMSITVISCTWDQLVPQVDCSLSPIVIELIDSNQAECGRSVGNLR
jgi:hypothetical protein